MANKVPWRRQERLHEIRSKERIYSITEGKVEYQYTAEMAARLATWAKERRSQGKSMLFKEFFDSLSYIDQGQIRILKWDGGRTFTTY
jgi:hypothetical protein